MASNTPNNPLRDYPFLSIIVDTMLSERSSSYVGNWTLVEPGTPFAAPPTHSKAEAEKYAGTISLGQKAGKDNEFQERYWATIPHTQDVHNYNITFDQEENAFPAFKRRYLELRDTYAARTKATAFTGLYAVTATAKGAGYDPANPPAVTCDGGAMAIAVVDPLDGSIAKITLKSEGASCTTSVTIAAPPVGGTQATAAGVLQPASCVLIKEQVLDAPEPWNALYLLVERTYETVPGPTVNTTRIDFDGKVVNIAKTKKLLGDINSGESKTLTVYTKTTKEDAGNGVYGYEVIETREIGGNIRPATAWQFGIAVKTTSQLLAVEDLVGDFTGVVGSAFVRKYKQPYNESAIVGMQFVESWPLNGPLVPQTEWRTGIPVSVTRQLLKSSDLVTARGISGDRWVVQFIEQFEYSEDVGIQVTESWPLPSEIATETVYKSGIAVATTRELVKVSDAVTSRGIVGSDWVWKYREPFEQSDDVCFQITETWPLNGPSVPEVDKKEGILVTTTTQLIKASDVVLDAGTVDGGGTHWIIKTRRQFEQSPDVCFQVTESWPIAGPLVVEVECKSGILVSTTVQLLAVGSIVTDAGSISGSNWIIKTRKSFDSATAVAFQIIETWPLAGPLVPEVEKRNGILVTTTTQLVKVSDVVTDVGSISGSNWIIKLRKQFADSTVVCLQIIETWPLNTAPDVVDVDKRMGLLVQTETKLVKVSDVIESAGNMNGTDWVVSLRKSFMDSTVVCLQITETWPTGTTVTVEVEKRQGILVTVTTQLVEIANVITDAGSISGDTWVIQTQKQFENSAVVCIQVAEIWPLSGPLVPMTEYRRGIAVVVTHQLIKTSDVVTSRAVVGSDWVVKTQKDFEESAVVCLQVIETWPLNGPSVPKTEWRNGVAVTTTVQLMPSGSVVTTHAISGSTWLVKNKEQFEDSTVVAFQVIDSWALPGQLVPDIDVREGCIVTTTEQIIVASTGVTNETSSGGNRVKKYVKRFQDSSDVAIQVIETWVLDGTAIPEAPLSLLDGTVLSITRQLRLISSITPGESEVSSVTWKKVTQKAFEDSTVMAFEFTELKDTPGAVLKETKIDFDGIVKETDVTVKQVDTISSGEIIIGTDLIQTRKELIPGTSIVAKEVMETRSLLSNILTSTEIDSDSKPVVTDSQLLPVGSISTGETLVGSTQVKITRQKFEGSALAAFQKTATRDIPGNPVATARLDDRDGDKVLVETTVVDTTTISPGETISGADLIRTTKIADDSALVAKQIVETKNLPGPALESTKIEDSKVATTVEVVKDASLITSGESLPGGTSWIQVYRRKIEGSSITAIEVTETMPIPGEPIPGSRIDSADGAPIAILTTKKAVGSITTGDTYATSVWTRITERPIGSKYVAEEVKETRALPGPVLSGQQIDKTSGIVFNFSKQLVPTGTVSGGRTGATVLFLSIFNAGTGFTSNPTLTIDAPPSGVTATATATYSAPGTAGVLANLTLTNAGGGYTSIPTVGFTGGGSGATATAKLIGTTIRSFTVTNGGSGFTDVPDVALSGGGDGFGGAGTAVLTSTTVASVTVDAGGSGYTTPIGTISGGGGTGALVTVHQTAGVVTSITIDNAGSGFTTVPTILIADSMGGTGTGATATVVLVGTSIASITVDSTGTSYTDVPTAAFSGGGGSGATAVANLAPTSIDTLTLTAPGSGWTAPTVTFSGGGGSGAAATVGTVTGTITGYAITNPGSGYLTAPNVTISGGGGTGGVILALIGSLTYIEVEPINTVADLVMRTTVLLASLPAAKVYPVSYRVQHRAQVLAYLLSVSGKNGTRYGLVENTNTWGSGSEKVNRRLDYFTDSQYQAYNPGAFSVTGRSRSYTLVGESVDGEGNVGIETFRPTPQTLGTSAGVLDIEANELQYGLWKVWTTYSTVNY